MQEVTPEPEKVAEKAPESKPAPHRTPKSELDKPPVGENLNFKEQIKTIDICACGPLRVSASLVNGGLLKEGSKIIMITSQGGSVTWRTTQNPTGHDYGHHVRTSLLYLL